MELLDITASEYSQRLQTKFAHLFEMEYGLSIQRGWGPAVESALETIDLVLRTYGGTVSIWEVKQKLGELRISAGVGGEPTIWITCKDEILAAERERVVVDGRMVANNHEVGYALAAGETLWRRDDDGSFEPAVEEALRQYAVHSLVREALRVAKRQASITCEFCGKYGRFDRSNGYLAIACEDHSGPGRQPLHRGDEFASTFVEPEWSRKHRSTDSGDAA